MLHEPREPGRECLDRGAILARPLHVRLLSGESLLAAVS